MMRSDTQSVTIEAHAGQVFEFLADTENLPRWAVGFCRSIRRDGEHWIVQTAQGDVGIRYVTDPTIGVIDFRISPAPGAEFVAHSRVVPNGDGAEYIFTQFHVPGMPNHVFEANVAALGEELVVLKALLRARATFPA
jgi:hypothetical protein